MSAEPESNLTRSSGTDSFRCTHCEEPEEAELRKCAGFGLVLLWAFHGKDFVQQHKSDNRDRAPLAGFEVGRCGEHSSASREFAKGGYSYDVRRNKKVVLWIKKGHNSTRLRIRCADVK